MAHFSFSYHPEIITRYPDLVGGVVAASGLRNDPTPESLQAEYKAEQAAQIARIGKRSLSEIPSLAAWRAAFRAFGTDPTQYRSAAESLLRRLTKEGDIPFINTLVDLGNLVSIRYGLPTAVVDTRYIKDGLTVHFASGTERYTTLNEADIKHPDVGEVIFSDADALVFARRWCWRQSEQSASRADTTDIIITFEAHHKGGRADVEKGVSELAELLIRYAEATPKNVRTAILDAHQPRFDATIPTA
jgi:DNA/RNA-binding domain of Phe-tRNA-synthetase-like protein